MAIKKSELYSSLWASCDELRGSMDASQYKDYVLVLLFIKYVSDKYAGQPFAPITIPAGASFADMVALKGSPDIGDQINKRIVGPLAAANKLADMPDFNDATKLGTGKEMVDRLTNLIATFENPALDFSKNRADGDDILGDAYEYLMRHFATESGKSKGQFYTPAEVSRVMAKIIGIGSMHTTSATTVYDPTCGSGSLLLKVGDEASAKVTLYGQEKDSATSGLARMNMILHDNPTAEIHQGNTLADPKFKVSVDGQDVLKTFDYVVANPPFSDKRWSTGLDPLHDPYGRFETFGVPPAKQGDFAYLLHIIRSLKSTGQAACILPHGVLFRGNAEADIRKNLIRHGYIRGIIGLPANLFYGTGIPACIIVIDKQNAQARKGIFMLDASGGYMKDGPKNRLREQDIHQIVDVFTKQIAVPKLARMVSLEEIEKNDFNLNLPRYIESSVAEDLQDIAGHLKGGIPVADIDSPALKPSWDMCPTLRQSLFSTLRPGYLSLSVDKTTIKTTIHAHAEFTAFVQRMNTLFADWQTRTTPTLKALQPGFHPKQLIAELSENLLAHYTGQPLIDEYAVYQHLMDYWANTMQDDAYLIAADGWKAETYRIIEVKKNKDGKVTKTTDKGWACDLVPKPLIVARYFAQDQAAIDELAADLESITAQITELEEEHSGDDAAFSGFDKINKAGVTDRLREIKGDPDALDEADVLSRWLELAKQEADLKKQLRDAEAALDTKALTQYPQLSEADTQALVVNDKWLAALRTAIHGEMDRISQALTQRLKELADRYDTPMPQIASRVTTLEAKVSQHLAKMGFVWN
ncbi:type I restriction-modification system subunit M [Comamonas testosteroni]|uniref:type I restriction-modification system subunit M n=1 Tax=Comamonas testosteroni TaxID=285 RepID=UPI00389AB95B